MYYSQCKQDRFLNEVIFKNKRKGVFIDIGANDGITFSNSYFFEKELEWTGICFEPLEGAFEKLKKIRNCILINGCAASFNGIETFFAVEGYGEMLSGLKSKYDPRHLKRLYHDVKEYGGAISEIPMQCYDVNELLNKNGLKEIDFLSVDTEGGELDILKAIDFDVFKINVITVENNFKDDELFKYLISKGYEKIKNLEVDEVFVKRSTFNFFQRLFFKYAIFR